MSTSVVPAFDRRVVEMASMLALQAPGADAHFDVLEEWGRDVALFFTRLHTEEHRASFMLAAVSNLCTTFQDQVDTRRHLPWLSWGRLWLPLTVEASRASLRTFMAGLDIEDPLASSQQSPPVVATVPEPSNNREGRGRGASPAVDHSSKLDPSPPDGDDDLQNSTDSAGSDDGKINEETPARPTSASRAKRPRELSPQVDTRPSNDQMHSLPTNRSSKRSRLSSFRTFSHKGRSSDELMQHYDLRDPCEVVRKCKRCAAKRSAKPCFTILRLNQQTDKYVLSERCLRCILEKRKCQWPAGAVIKNTERREHVESRHPSLTKDRSITPEPLPGPSSATATKQAKHTSRTIPRLPMLKAEVYIDVPAYFNASRDIKPEVINAKVSESPVPAEGGDEEAGSPKVADEKSMDSELADTGDPRVDHSRSRNSSSSSRGPGHRTIGVQADIRADI